MSALLNWFKWRILSQPTRIIFPTGLRDHLEERNFRSAAWGSLLQNVPKNETSLSADFPKFSGDFRWSVGDSSPVHVVLVSLLVDQLSGLFLIFFGWPKKNCPISGNFWSVTGNIWSTKFLFGVPKFFLVNHIFFWSTKNTQRTKKFPKTGQDLITANRVEKTSK